MRTSIFIPPASSPTGGINVLLQVAAVLRESGRDTRLIFRERPRWDVAASPGATVPTEEWSRMHLGPEDLWLVPEGWVNALAPGLEGGARCVSYCQNWAYAFSALPEGVTWAQLPVEHLAVSRPVAWFLEQSAGITAPVLRPGIDQSIFYPPETKPEGPIRVAWMPRKNKAQAQQIRQLFESRTPGTLVHWIEIKGLDAHGVADVLRGCHIFLVTGFPEGCPLPPLEAMACGCLPVGFTGFGGWDYMRPVQPAPRFRPWWPLREVPWTGNGLWTADCDVLDAALCLEQAIFWFEHHGSNALEGQLLDIALEAGQQTVCAYSREAQAAAVLETWNTFES